MGTHPCPLVVSVDENTLLVLGLRSSCRHIALCIYQRPIPQNLNASIHLFAGKCVIYCEAVNDLDSKILKKWDEKWQMKFINVMGDWNVG